LSVSLRTPRSLCSAAVSESLVVCRHLMGMRWIPSMLPVRTLVTAGLALVAGCAKPPEPAEPPHPPARVGELFAYAPLEAGTVMAYETHSEESGDRGVVIWRVRRPREGLIELDDGGHVERLEVEPNALRHATGGYWLKAPLEEGACWQGRNGEVCVKSLDRRIEVPAGRFTECLETEELRGNESTGMRTTTVFCPNVGMVMLEVEAWAVGTVALERAELRSYGPAVDIHSLEE
jgi:hypothetical protein